MTDTMNTNRFPMLALAVAAALAQAAATSPAHAQVQSDPSLDGFSLPPSDRQPEAQGPVTEGVSRPRAPRPAPTPPPAPVPATPPPAIAIPAPTQPAPAPRAQAPAAQPVAPRSATPSAPVAAPTASAPSAQAQAPVPSETAAPTPATPAAPASALPSLPLPKAASESTAPAPATSGKDRAITETPLFRWGMLAALLAIFGLAIAIAWQRFVRNEARVAVPMIEPPRPRPRTEPEATSAPEPAAPAKTLLEQLDEEEDAEAALPLRCAFEVTRLSVTLMTATLSYRITLTNVSDRLFRDVSVGGDMVSAHSSLSMEQQMANAGEALEIRHQVPAMLPGQSIFLSGDLMLPIHAIRAVRRGDAALFVPLARLKIEAEGLEMALLRTSLVGQRPAGPGAGLRPFRLDLGPRIYSEIGQRTLAVPA